MNNVVNKLLSNTCVCVRASVRAGVRTGVRAGVRECVRVRMCMCVRAHAGVSL